MGASEKPDQRLKVSNEHPSVPRGIDSRYWPCTFAHARLSLDTCVLSSKLRCITQFLAANYDPTPWIYLLDHRERYTVEVPQILEHHEFALENIIGLFLGSAPTNSARRATRVLAIDTLTQATSGGISLDHSPTQENVIDLSVIVPPKVLAWVTGAVSIWPSIAQEAARRRACTPVDSPIFSVGDHRNEHGTTNSVV